MFPIAQKAKFLLPVALTVLLVGCGTAPAMPPVPTVPASIPNPLAGLPANLPNMPSGSDLNSAMQGLGALGQLGQAMNADGTLKDPNAMNNLINTFEQMDQQQKLREYQQQESVDMPDGVPDFIKGLAYTNGKLVNAAFESMEPADLRLSYRTTDTVKTVGDFYRNAIKNPNLVAWKLKGQANGSDTGHTELQSLQGTRDDRIYIEYTKDSGLTAIKIRFYNYSM